MSSAPIVPKRERSPTPPLTTPTTLQPRTSGVKLVAPLPKACQRSSQNYFQARKEWLREEIKALTALGLTVTNKFIRDDGLSLEWESPVPVWPDSLKPVNLPSTSSASPTTRHTTQEEVIDVDVEMQVEAEPEPETVSVRSISGKEDLERQATELEDLAIEFLKKYVRTFDTNRAGLSGAYAHNALFSYSAHEHITIPRNSVAAAFTNPGAALYRFAPRKGSRNLLHSGNSGPGSGSGSETKKNSAGNVYSGPSEIVNALQSLGPHKFCARSPTDLRWNVLALQLGPNSRSSSDSSRIANKTRTEPLVYLSSHGDLTLTEDKGTATSGVRGERRLSFDQCFLLQKPHGSKGKGKETRRGSGEEPGESANGSNHPRNADTDTDADTDLDAEWPLVAINHQLMVRDLSFMPGHLPL